MPEELRPVLEATLSQDASLASLERYLPQVRDIVMNLVHVLKKKQAEYERQVQEKETTGKLGSVELQAAAQSVAAITGA